MGIVWNISHSPNAACDHAFTPISYTVLGKLRHLHAMNDEKPHMESATEALWHYVFKIYTRMPEA